MNRELETGNEEWKRTGELGTRNWGHGSRPLPFDVNPGKRATHLRHNLIEFVFHPDSNIPPILLIKDQIKQVILNICLNAVEAMPEGGNIFVRSNYLEHESCVLITITDTGPSIKPEILPDIFDPFVTSKEGGTGLGLAITYDIVQRHQGKIEVESVPPLGTTFKVRLPLSHQFEAGQRTSWQWI